MKANLQLIYLLCQREFKRNLRNLSYLVTLSIPFVITLLYFQLLSNNLEFRRYSFSLFANLNVLTISLVSLSFTVYTDRDSNAETQLSLAGINKLSQIISKGIVTTIWVVLYQIFISRLYNLGILSTILFMFVSIVLSMVLQLLVTLISYKFYDSTLANSILTLIYTLLLLIPEFTVFNKFVDYSAKMLPTYYSKIIFDKLMRVHVQINSIIFILVSMVWVVIPILLIKKKCKKNVVVEEQIWE